MILFSPFADIGAPASFRSRTRSNSSQQPRKTASNVRLKGAGETPGITHSGGAIGALAQGTEQTPFEYAIFSHLVHECSK
jgi:hypothetical protein